MVTETDLNVEQFAALLQGRTGKNGRILGLDLGTKTIGMAISNSDWTIASPVNTIRRKKFTPDVTAMLDYARTEMVEGIVMGLPFNMDGSEGPRAQATRAFVRNMGAFTDLPVLYWDERLSSYAAEQAMLEADMTPRKRARNIDQIAAAIILQGCLDCLREAQAAGKT
jgi:putative Holliday junction resolvase